MSGRDFIPFHRPLIGEAEVAEVVATLRSGWLTTGPRTAQFEKEFGEYVGAPHALAVNSGTAALHLALAGLGLGRGDEVITTPLTFCATVNTILQVGATPVLADVGSDGNLDPESVAEHITPRTRAVVPVHLAGLPCEMDRIWSLARRHGLYVVEDAAHAAGSRYRGRPIGAHDLDGGSSSQAAAFSFYATKNITTGEGGMVTTSRAELAEKMKILCLHGIEKDAWNRYAEQGSWFYRVVECGFKYNLSDIQSAVGIHQLRRLEEFVRIRRRYARLYHEVLADLEEVELPPDRDDCRHSWHLYIMRLNLDKLDISRSEFIAILHERGIGCSVHFIPVLLHPYFKRQPVKDRTGCPRALELYPRLVSLPLYPAMREGEVEYVANTVREVVHAHRKPKAVAVRGAAAL